METFHLIVILLAGLITSWWMIGVSDALLNGEGFNKFFSGEWMQLFKFLFNIGIYRKNLVGFSRRHKECS